MIASDKSALGQVKTAHQRGRTAKDLDEKRHPTAKFSIRIVECLKSSSLRYIKSLKENNAERTILYSSLPAVDEHHGIYKKAGLTEASKTSEKCVYRARPPTKSAQGRTSEGMPSGLGSFSLMH